MSQPDYTAIEEHKLPETLGDDGAKWAAAFCQIAKKLGHDIDEGWMIGWFANAIEASSMKRARSQPAPEGWRPIAEAPKNEVIDIGWAATKNKKGRVSRGRWGVSGPRLKGGKRKYEGWHSYPTGQYISTPPTHYMPLPAPPEQPK